MPVATILTRVKTMGDPESEFMNKIFKLEPSFQSNLLEMLEENFTLQFITPSKGRSKSDFNEIEQDSTERWQRLIYFLLNIDQGLYEDDQFKQTYSELLAYANYYETRSKSAISLSSDGFQFILHDSRTQVQSLLLHYAKRIHKTTKQKESSR